MHNQYGSQLRDLVSRSYAVETVITMHDVDAFEADVSAYPAVIVLRNGEQSDANVVAVSYTHLPAFRPLSCRLQLVVAGTLI